jgi:hypothetical protein
MTSLNPYQSFSSGGVFPAAQPAKLPVRVTGQITADDVLAALKAVGKWRPWRTAFLFASILIVIAAHSAANRRRGMWIGSLFLVVPLLMALLALLRARRRLVNSWNARPEYQHPVSWTFSHEGLLIETVSSKTLRDWSGFLYAKVTPDRIVLAQPGDAMFNFVPRRFFGTEGDWVAVCQLLAAKLPVRETGSR